MVDEPLDISVLLDRLKLMIGEQAVTAQVLGLQLERSRARAEQLEERVTELTRQLDEQR